MMIRVSIIMAIFISFWIGMIVRLYFVSIDSSLYYEKLAKENIEKKNHLKPIRGQIYDVNGKLLAMNQIGFSVFIQPHLKKNSKSLNSVLNDLVEAFPALDREQLFNVYEEGNSAYNHRPIQVVNFIQYRDMLAVYPKLSLNPMLSIEAETRRYYPYGEYAAHIVGYIGKSNNKENAKDETVKVIGKVGKSGLEKYYNGILQGELGYEIEKVTATNKSIAVLKKVPAKDNHNIKLNIDIELQRMIHSRFEGQAGVAIVMKTNGELVAAVSHPSYNPNLFAGGISHESWKTLQEDPNRPFTNKLIQGLYPPGSTIKMGMALTYDKYVPGILHRHESCRGHITLGKSNHKFRCWSKGHGGVGLKRAIKESCDVYFYNKSLDVGIDKMAKGLTQTGLGVKTGIDLPKEFQGIMPNKVWKKKRYNQPWYMGETVIASIGQGYVLVTPMQVARHTAFLATGKLPTPRLAKSIDGKPSKLFSKKVKMNANHFRSIREGMYAVCNERKGTAVRAMGKLPIVVAGKTGTSQVSAIPQDVKERMKEEDMAYFLRSHAWFTSYAPYKSPEYIVTVLVEHGGHGGSAAGPIAADIYKWMYQHNYFPSQKALE
jgi:penicillin-binding protein 2